jgi:hypothetical protein
MFPLPLYYYFEFVALITSVVCLYKFEHKPLRWFIPFLLLIISADLAGLYIRKELRQVNTWLFNLSIPIEYLFYGCMIASLCITQGYKKVVFVCTAIFAVWVIINLVFIQGFVNLNTNTLKVGSVLMIFFCGLGFVDLFKNDSHISLLKNPLFWICTGVLFFNTGEFIYFFFFDVFLSNGWDKTAKLFASINNKLVFVLYSCISIAIICSKKLGKKV